MKQVKGSIWECTESHDSYIVIPTNGFIRKDGLAVMGRGLAVTAANKYAGLAGELGRHLKSFGNHVFKYDPYNVITFPVKHNWWEDADLTLIDQSMRELIAMLPTIPEECKIYMPRVGCGNGRLNWPDVKPVLEKHWDERVIIVYIR